MRSVAPAFPDAAASSLPVWRADQLAPVAGAGAVRPTGHAALDAELPGGGWPAAGLTELLLPAPGCGELRLLAPALAGLSVLWVAPPLLPYAPALAALGLAVHRLTVACPAGMADTAGPGRATDAAGHRKAADAAGPGKATDAAGPGKATDAAGPGKAADAAGPGKAADAAWATEQALRSGVLGAVLWWQGAAPVLPATLRRLHLAAVEGRTPLFALRPAALRAQSSPAPLRLALDIAGPAHLTVDVFKRRGPPLAVPLLLDLPGPAPRRSRPTPTPMPTPPPAALQPAELPAPVSSVEPATHAVVRAASERAAA